MRKLPGHSQHSLWAQLSGEEIPMKIRTIMLVLVLLPILVGGGFVLAHQPMNAPVVGILGAVMIWLAYSGYALWIDSNVIEPDAKKATPAKMYMDGVDFMPTGKNILYGYHFKSIAAAGPIVGPIVAVTLWGWLPSLIWLTLGVTFLGWASDYSAIMVAVRNDGRSLSATALVFAGPINSIVNKLDDGVNDLSGGRALYTVVDPTKSDPRLGVQTITSQGQVVPKY